MKKFIPLILGLLIAVIPLSAQQGTVVIKDRNSNNQADILNDHSLPVTIYGVIGSGMCPSTLPCYVTGTITVGSSALPTGAATSANQTNGDAKAQVYYGGTTTPILPTDVAPIGGNVAHDAVNSGNPVLNGCNAVAWGANPTAVAASDRSYVLCDRQGVPRVLSSPANPITIRASLTGAATDTALVSVSAGTKIGVTQGALTCSGSVSVAVSFVLGFGAATTPTTTGVVMADPGTQASAHSGLSRGTGAGVLGVGGDGEDLRYTSSAATSGSCDLVVTYFTIES